MVEKQKHNSQEQIEEQHIDAEWFDEFVDTETNQVFEYFRGDTGYRQEQRRLFEAGEIANPSLDYPKLDLADLRYKEARFLDLKQRILDDESAPESLKQIYRWSLNERIAENRMVQEAALAQTAETEEDRRRHMRRFDRYNEFLYGPQNEDVFYYYTNQIRDEAKGLLASDDERVVHAAQNLLQIFTEEHDVSFDVPALQAGTDRDAFRERVLAEYGLSADSVAQFLEMNTDFTPAEFASYCMRRQLEIPGSGAFSTFASDIATSTFNPLRKELQIAGKNSNGSERTYSAKSVLGLEMHENQGHLGRSARGYTSKLKILGFGLDRNFKPEEGNAMFNESAVAEAGDTMTGWAGVVAVGLAKGFDKPSGEQRMASRRDFADTHSALKAVYLVRNLAAGQPYEAADENAATQAWNRTTRTFRGTTADQPGVVYQRDIGYGEGFLETHAFFDKNHDRIVLLKFGRFNAMNDRHIKVLIELGILDEELAALASE